MKNIGHFQNTFWDLGKGICPCPCFCEGCVIELVQKHKEVGLCKFAAVWNKIKILGKKTFEF